MVSKEAKRYVSRYSKLFLAIRINVNVYFAYELTFTSMKNIVPEQLALIAVKFKKKKIAGKNLLLDALQYNCSICAIPCNKGQH